MSHSFFRRQSEGVLLMPYQIQEVDGVTLSNTINAFNKLVPEWPPLQQGHFTKGYWWLAYLEERPVAFAGLVRLASGAGETPPVARKAATPDAGDRHRRRRTAL